jgi:hypothetical protein
VAGSWAIVRRALYVDGFLFADSSFFPRSVGRAWWTMETKHSLAVWAPERADDLELDSGRVGALVAEKADAVAGARAYAERVRLGHPTIPEALHRQLVDQAEIFVTYVEGFEACARVCILARAVERGVIGDPKALAGAVADLEAYGAQIKSFTKNGRHPHQVSLLLDPLRVADIARGGRDVLAKATEQAV